MRRVMVVAACLMNAEAFLPIAFKAPAAMSSRTQTVAMSSSSEVAAPAMSRRSAVLAAAAALALAVPPAAHALFSPNDEAQRAVTSISSYVPKVRKLVQDLKSKTLKGGPDDSVVVLKTAKAYFEPLQSAMEAAAPKLALSNKASQERAVTLSLLMKGHLLELNAACKSQVAAEQLKEVEEVEETLEEFLKLASAKYVVATFEPKRSATPAEYYGAFGCEAWGQKRMENSNMCEQDKTVVTTPGSSDAAQ